MPQFIRTDDGLVNADHIAHARHRHDGKVVLRDRDGKSLGVADQDDLETGILIPAAAGIFATVITVNGVYSAAPPTADCVYVDRVPIVAWRISRYTSDSYIALPVVAGIGSDQTALIERPNGDLDSPDDRLYENLDAAKADFLEKAQREWQRLADRKAAKAEAAE
jgi:hypothetical protein